jgi:hypothetical protein
VGLLVSLTAAVQSVHEELSGLRRICARQAAEISCLRELCGVHFTFFPKLPLDKRLEIWRLALTEPQVHVISEKRISVSRVNIIMQVCREARAEGRRLRFSYYEIGTPRWYGFNDTAITRQYMNVDVDTIYLEEIDSLSLLANFRCGGCLRKLSLAPVSRCVCPRTRQLGALAVRYRNAPESADLKIPTLARIDHLLYLRPRELLIVIGDAAATDYQDIRFREPTQGPDNYSRIRRVAWDNPDPEAINEKTVKGFWEHQARGTESILSDHRTKELGRILEKSRRMCLIPIVVVVDRGHS